MKYIILSILLIVTFAAAAFFTYRAGFWRVNYLDAEGEHNLDVSHHQGKINWPAVPRQKYRFVYIKATEGGDFRDTRFQENWQEARKAGFETGAYHFFTLCRPGADQAGNFIENVPVEEVALPPAIDLEFIGNCSKRPPQKEFEAELGAFMEMVSVHYGQKPILYTTQDFFQHYLAKTQYATYPLWVRSIWGKPPTVVFPKWHIWQYADNAKVPGIDTLVDLNIRK